MRPLTLTRARAPTAVLAAGIVPRHDANDERVGADPKWLADGFAWVRGKLPTQAQPYLEPGRQLGPWFYAPTLTAVVAPFAFGFLVGPATLNRRADGALGGLVVEKCKFLQESNCKGMCLNSCKLPAQQLFDELGLPLRRRGGLGHPAGDNARGVQNPGGGPAHPPLGQPAALRCARLLFGLLLPYNVIVPSTLVLSLILSRSPSLHHFSDATDMVT